MHIVLTGSLSLVKIAKDVWDFRVESEPGKALMEVDETKKLSEISYAEAELKASFTHLQLERLRTLDQNEP